MMEDCSPTYKSLQEELFRLHHNYVWQMGLFNAQITCRELDGSADNELQTQRDKVLGEIENDILALEAELAKYLGVYIVEYTFPLTGPDANHLRGNGRAVLRIENIASDLTGSLSFDHNTLSGKRIYAAIKKYLYSFNQSFWITAIKRKAHSMDAVEFDAL